MRKINDSPVRAQPLVRVLMRVSQNGRTMPASQQATKGWQHAPLRPPQKTGRTCAPLWLCGAREARGMVRQLNAFCVTLIHTSSPPLMQSPLSSVAQIFT